MKDIRPRQAVQRTTAIGCRLLGLGFRVQPTSSGRGTAGTGTGFMWEQSPSRICVRLQHSERSDGSGQASIT